jgi:hypothetical protein
MRPLCDVTSYLTIARPGPMPGIAGTSRSPPPRKNAQKCGLLRPGQSRHHYLLTDLNCLRPVEKAVDNLPSRRRIVINIFHQANQNLACPFQVIVEAWQVRRRIELEFHWYQPIGVRLINIVHVLSPHAIHFFSSTSKYLPPLTQNRASCSNPTARWQHGPLACLSQHNGQRSMCQ